MNGNKDPLTSPPHGYKLFSKKNAIPESVKVLAWSIRGTQLSDTFIKIYILLVFSFNLNLVSYLVITIVFELSEGENETSLASLQFIHK